MRIVFFGSFQHYSALILESLIQDSNIDVVGVVTTPPMPVGRKQIITKTPVHLLAEQHQIPVFTPQTLSASPTNDARSRTPLAGVEDVDLRDALNDPPGYFITAGYGKILPESWLSYPKLGSLNLHFSLLPAYRGANPAEWAIMCGETKTGITLIEMSDKLDGGDIIAQSEIPITNQDTRETLYEKLYTLGAEKLPEWLTAIQKADTLVYPYTKQPTSSSTPYAALLKRNDGFIPWSAIQNLNPKPEDFPSKHLQKALNYCSCRHVDLTTQGSEAELIKAERSRVESKTYVERMFLCRLPRAFAGYPSLWTIVNTTKGEKRMKIVAFEPYIIVQIEGGQPTHFNQIKNQII